MEWSSSKRAFGIGEHLIDVLSTERLTLYNYKGLQTCVYVPQFC